MSRAVAAIAALSITATLAYAQNLEVITQRRQVMKTIAAKTLDRGARSPIATCMSLIGQFA
jgi:hypothetical protein